MTSAEVPASVKVVVVVLALTAAVAVESEATQTGALVYVPEKVREPAPEESVIRPAKSVLLAVAVRM